MLLSEDYAENNHTAIRFEILLYKRSVMPITKKPNSETTAKKELGTSKFTVTNITPEFDDKNDKPRERQMIESLYRIFSKYEKVQK